MLVYGTIIGIYGNRHPSFMEDIQRQSEDIYRLSQIGDGFCFCGDFNCTFADNYYFTKAGREALLETLKANNIRLLSEKVPECIDHIAVSKDFAGSASIHIEEWNLEKKLSDHKGLVVTI